MPKYLKQTHHKISLPSLCIKIHSFQKIIHLKFICFVFVDRTFKGPVYLKITYTYDCIGEITNFYIFNIKWCHGVAGNASVISLLQVRIPSRHPLFPRAKNFTIFAQYLVPGADLSMISQSN